MRRLILAASLFVAACAMTNAGGPPAARQVAPILTGPEAHDASSFARPEIARVTHVALDLDADFEARRMAGTATLDIVAAPGAEEIILDSRGLEIERITDS
ncbi:MAG TPA: aminopeptidase, partial [Allosphingosinicella sp.]|nr:aminopeptidase [Allosphingosinicella sp.]